MLIFFSVKDLRTQAFQSPFFDVHAGAAIRSFESECKRPESLLFKFPGDFELYRLGTFDPASGAIVPEEPVLLMRGLDSESASALF